MGTKRRTKAKTKGRIGAQLSERAQGWIEEQGWTALRHIQTESIPPLLEILRTRATTDVVVSSPTASGKTEAVFLPIATLLDEEAPAGGIEVLYICPLIALINQQADRLRKGLIDTSRNLITPWHGRAAQAGKNRLEEAPGGILIITPESLESQFIRRGGQLKSWYKTLRCIVIDEFHAFFNNPRGVQLLSQLNRIDLVADRRIPRFALSATFDAAARDEIAKQLRPTDWKSVKFLTDEHGHELHFAVKCFSEQSDSPRIGTDRRNEDIARAAYDDFRDLPRMPTGERGKGLIFVNSRKEAEFFADRLHKLALKDGRDVEFHPHHGSLEQNLREKAEEAVRSAEKAAVVVCTSTLELGIDIGMITQVGQVDPGSSVSSLHQRLGRSGRRHGQISQLIMYLRDAEIDRRKSPLTELHLPTFQAFAQISLVQDKAYEPPDRRPAHLSTLIQQILSLAAQQGGFVTQDVVRTHLVDLGPFHALRRENDPDDHLALLFARLEMAELLERRTEIGYALTTRARRMMDNHHFYAAFQTGEDYRVYAGTELLGTVPSAHLYKLGDLIIYARRPWRITGITHENRTIHLDRADDGEAPLFSGSPIPPSQAVIRRMQQLYAGSETPHEVEMNETAGRLFGEGIEAYERLGLKRRSIVDYGNGVLLMPWLDERGQSSLQYALRFWGVNATSANVAVFAEGVEHRVVETLLTDLANGTKEVPEPAEAMRSASTVLIDKHDRLLSPYLQRWNAATFRLDMDGVSETARRLLHVQSSAARGNATSLLAGSSSSPQASKVALKRRQTSSRSASIIRSRSS